MIDPNRLLNCFPEVSLLLQNRRVDARDINRARQSLLKKKEINQQLDRHRESLNKLTKDYHRLLDNKAAELLCSHSCITKELLYSRLLQLKSEIKGLELQHVETKRESEALLLTFPNLPNEAFEVGGGIATPTSCWHEIESNSNQKAIPFSEIADDLKLIDMPRARKISGTGFSIYRGDGAKLLRALMAFGLRLHAAGYEEVILPHMVLKSSMIGSGHLPKFSQGAFELKSRPLWTIPTAEVPLVALHRGETIDLEDLPLAYVAQTSCFRDEIGNGGNASKQRLHEYYQIELMRLCTTDQAAENFCQLIGDSTRALEALDIPHRVTKLNTAELPFAASNAYRVDVYAAGQRVWLPVSTASCFSDFQARRSGIKYRQGRRNSYVVTMNASALAVSRIWGVILEQGRQADGSVRLPLGLKPFLEIDSLSPELPVLRKKAKLS